MLSEKTMQVLYTVIKVSTISEVYLEVLLNLENILAISRKTNLEIFLATTRTVSSYS